jgi:L-lactate dehydrogenase complex protein LldG
VVLLDNGRSKMLGGKFQDMLRCIRCGACMNHCPVYGAVGGHAYGWVYPGPMGAVLTPLLRRRRRHAAHLPNACTFCGRCESVCPVRIPLPKMMRTGASASSSGISARVAMFKAQALGALATVAEVASASEAPAEIARYLREANLPATIRMGEDARLAALPWGATALDVSRGASDGHDLNGVSHAAGGVAETGTLILTSGPDNPTTVNFLPDNHIVLVDARDIARDYEGAWTALRATFGAGHMPRVVNMITGPSRSGDIEQTLLLGAHGPRNLHVVIVGEA